MTVFLTYLLKVSICTGCLYTVYYLLFRRHTFFQTNRLCLLFIVCFSFLVPSISISVPEQHLLPTSFDINNYTATDKFIEGDNFYDNHQQHRGGIHMFILFIYLTGASLATYRFLRSLIRLYRFDRQTLPEIQDGFRVKRTDFHSSFTFLSTIYLPMTERDENIFTHEQTHVKQFHWIDLLVVEIALIILWFNPVLILIKRELRLHHEFLADRSVLENGVPFEVYARCLLKHMNPARIDFKPVSQLNSSSNKKRIVMMTRPKSSSLFFACYLLILPCCLMTLMSFGKREGNSVIIPAAQRKSFENIPDIAPVDFAKVTRVVLYGDILNPETNKRKNHTGIDFQLNAGSDVVATADGVVVVQSYGEKRGNFVVIRHSATFSTRYYHFSETLVKVGDRVKKGQVIGLVGNTGLSKVPHLHYEVLKNDTQVDPKEYLPMLPGS